MAASSEATANLIAAAAMVAAAAPAAPGRHVVKAQIPWPLVDDLRVALTAIGVDWQKVQRSYHGASS